MRLDAVYETIKPRKTWTLTEIYKALQCGFISRLSVRHSLEFLKFGGFKIRVSDLGSKVIFQVSVLHQKGEETLL